MDDPAACGKTPRWVWIAGIAVGVVVVLAILLTLLPGDGPLGDHGPDRHQPVEAPEGHDQSRWDHG